MSKQPIIYVVDPDSGWAGALGALLQAYGISVRGFEAVPDYLDAIRSGQLDDSVLFLCLDFPGFQPEDLLKEVCTPEHCVPTIAICSQKRGDGGRAAQAGGADPP